MKPAIILSSHNTGLSVIRSLSAVNVPIVVVCYSKRDMGYVSKYVKEVIWTPHPENKEGEFIELLMGNGERYKGSMLIPCDDETLVAVSKHKELLGKYFIVACTEWSVTERLIDKQYTYELAETIGVPCPRTIMPSIPGDLEQRCAGLHYPCLVKPCQSHKYLAQFNIKMRKVEDYDHLRQMHQEASDVGLEVVIQEYIPGDDSHSVNYNSYFWDREPLVEFTAVKVRQSPPSFGVPRVVMSKDISEIIEPGRAFLKGLGYYGYSCTEFKKDPRDGIYKLMEVNGRYNRSGILSTRCGINFPALEYQHLLHGVAPKRSNFIKGIYWIDSTKDIFTSIKYFFREGFSLVDYIKPYCKPNIYAVLDEKDIRPFLKRCFDIFCMGLKWIFTKPLH